MIGWKIVARVSTIDGVYEDLKEVACEVVGMPFYTQGLVLIPVYHDKVIKMSSHNEFEHIKVLERK